MPTNSSIPSSYDEIVRRTVPDLDSSARPTLQQETQSREGFRAMDDGERVLYARVSDALLMAGVAMGKIQPEIDRGRVTLRGNVPDAATIDRVEQLVREVQGVSEVENKLVVAGRG